MNRTNVFTRDGIGIPRRCPIQTASGSIVAADSEVASILRGVVGTIIDETRITIVVQDRRPTASTPAENTHLSSSATKAALSTKYRRPASVFVAGPCEPYRT